MKEVLFGTAWGPVALALTVGCLTLLATLMALGKPRSAWLKGRLELYGGAAGAVGSEPEEERTWRPDMERFYGTTDRLFAGTRLWKNLERMAERAHVGWRPMEIVAWSVAASIAAGLVVAMLLSSGLLAVLAALAALITPFVMLSGKGKRRLRAFDEQLPDVLMTMASALKVGQSFDNSMKAIAEDGLPPASEEFGRVLAETRLGRPLDDALVGMADRIDSEDLRFVLMSVTIQRQVGGNLGDLFHSVSDTVRERQQFRRKVRALTAMGRATATLLLALPFVTGALFAVIGDGYINTLFTTEIGRTLVAAMLVLMAIGAVVIRKIVDIKG